MTQKHHAFTAVELIVVLVIIGILSMAITPVISRFLPGVQLVGSSRTLTANLREMQEKAVSSQNQHLIRFFPTEIPPRYQLIQISDSVETVIREEYLPTSQSITLEETISSNQIIFSPDGGPSSSGDITISNSDKTKTIGVSPAGFISIK